jgi:hypothetical protein
MPKRYAREFRRDISRTPGRRRTDQQSLERDRRLPSDPSSVEGPALPAFAQALSSPASGVATHA